MPSTQEVNHAARLSDGQGAVEVAPLNDEALLPLVVTPTGDVDLVAWAEAHRDSLESALLDHGGLLFRGFDVSGTDTFSRFIEAVSGTLLEYTERSSPRSAVDGNVYTSTEHPPDQPIFFHNENSYQQAWPRKIFFGCDTPPDSGGETPLADIRKVTAAIPDDIAASFEEKGILYVRNYGRIGLTWQEVFQTEDRAKVEAHCEKKGLDYEWKDNGGLRTRCVRPAFATHPVTGERLWFNHATFFHVSTLEPSVREALLSAFDRDQLPNHTYYGDGSPIDDDVVASLREIYRTASVEFPWQQDDIVMLDNMLTAHARNPFSGDRLILAGMSEPLAREDA